MCNPIFPVASFWAVVICSHAAAGQDFWAIAEAGDTTQMSALLAAGQNVDEPAPESGFTAVIVAARGKQLEMVKFLVRNGADVNATCALGRTALFYAAQSGQLELVQYLLDVGAEIDRFGPGGHPPLSGAVNLPDDAVARLLIKRGAGLDVGNSTGWTPMHDAARHNRAASVTLLVEAGAKVSPRMDHSITPLMVAAMNGSLESVKALLNAGASPDETNGDWTAVGEAAENGHREVVLLLAEAGADLSADPMHGAPPLSYAAIRGDVLLTRQLIKMGAPVPTYASGAFEAIKAGQGATAVVLMEHGARFYLKQWDEAFEKSLEHSDLDCYLTLVRCRRTAHDPKRDPFDTQQVEFQPLKPIEESLLRAAYYGETQRINEVLDKHEFSPDEDWLLEAAQRFAVSEGRIDAARSLSREAGLAQARRRKQELLNAMLYSAAGKGDAERAARLIQDGAQVKAWDPNESSPMYITIYRGHVAVVEILLKNGASVDRFPGSSRRTPLAKAAESVEPQIVRLLLDHGADAKTDHKALYSAAGAGNIKALRMLLEAGAKVDALHYKNQTALMYAAMNGHADCVAALLEAGANPDLVDRNGQTAVKLAFAANHAEAMALLSLKAELPEKATDLRARIRRVDLQKPERIKELLEAGADPGAPLIENYDPNEPPLEAIVNGGSIGEKDIEIVKMLLEHGADPNHPPGLLSRISVQPLWATQGLEFARLLIDAGADVNASSPAMAHEMPPILSAAYQLSPPYFDMLLEAGADPTARDGRGQDVIRISQTHRIGAATEERKREMAKHIKKQLAVWQAKNNAAPAPEAKP